MAVVIQLVLCWLHFLVLGIFGEDPKLWTFASPWGQRLTTSVDMTKTRCLERTNLVEGKGLLTEGICWWVFEASILWTLTGVPRRQLLRNPFGGCLAQEAFGFMKLSFWRSLKTNHLKNYDSMIFFSTFWDCLKICDTKVTGANWPGTSREGCRG